MNDIYDILVEEYGMTPAQVDELMALGVLAGQQESIVPRQQAYAKELRQVETPRGRRYEGVYKEAHPLEFVGAGLQSAAGHYGEWKARQRQEEILKEQAARRAAYLRGMRRPQTSGLPAPGTPQQQPPAQPAASFAVNLPQGTPYDQWEPYIGPQPLNTRR